MDKDPLPLDSECPEVRLGTFEDAPDRVELLTGVDELSVRPTQFTRHNDTLLFSGGELRTKLVALAAGLVPLPLQVADDAIVTLS